MWDALYAIALKAAHDICKVPNMKTNHTKTSSPSFIPFFFSSTTHAFSFSLSRFSLRRHNHQLSCFAIDFLSCRVIGAWSRTRVGTSYSCMHFIYLPKTTLQFNSTVLLEFRRVLERSMHMVPNSSQYSGTRIQHQECQKHNTSEPVCAG